MKNNNISKVILCLSIFCLGYFILLVYWSYNPPSSTGALRVVGELLTIPMLGLMFFSLFYGFISILKKRNVKISKAIFLCNLLSVLFLLVVTIKQLKS